MSGFGLSAFFFSLLAHTLFPGNTSALLLTLAIGTATPMLMGLLIVKPVPLPTRSNAPSISTIEGYDPIPSNATIFIEPQTTLGPVMDTEADSDSTPLLSHEREPTSYRVLVPSTIDVDLDPSVCLRPQRNVGDRDVLPDIYGKQLWLSPDFYLLFVIITICA